MSSVVPLHRLVLLGEEGVGKTALAIQFYIHHFVPTYDPTIEDSYQKQVVVDGRACAVQVLDTAGQKDYSILRDQWIQHGQSFFLSFSNVRDLYANIRQTKESLDPHHLGPILLIGNKCDVESERAVSTQEGHALALELGCGFVKTSAKDGRNVGAAFYDTARMLRRRRTAALVEQQRCTRKVDGPSADDQGQPVWHHFRSILCCSSCIH
ncbi:putative RAS-2 protein [Apiospora arundinis]|uniref:RAS-2 protein n=1 Tax=Apiospora arundinis TaxID=335852 RepID=A0ABR2J3S9_9PEZI